MAAGETYCATLRLIFCQVIPELCEWCEAAVRETVLQFEDTWWLVFMLLKCLWAKLWISACSRDFVWFLTLTSDLQKTIYCAYRGQKSISNTKNNSMDGIYGATAKRRSVLAEQRGGLFPSLVLMPNEGTWVHHGNPRRRELIPPGGISRDVKYVSWYLCRATLNGFYI